MLIFGLIDKMAGFNHAKIWKSFQDILVKKEDVNTFAVNKLDLETDCLMKVKVQSNSVLLMNTMMDQ